MRSTDFYVVVGLGETGLSCIKYLKNQGVSIGVVDSRLNPPHATYLRDTYPEISVSLGSLDSELFKNADQIILSPGISKQEPVIQQQIKRGVSVIGDIELFAQAVKKPVISITGTNAKSTVTTLVGKMAQASGIATAVGGNIGIPALDLLSNNKTAELFLLELSSFQLETTHSLRPKIATILNLAPDHMDRYVDFAAYCAAKHRIYEHCEIAICNRDDPLTEYKNSYIQKWFFTLNKPKENEFGLLKEQQETYLAYEDKLLIPITELPIIGKHYQANALASLAIGHAYNLPIPVMLQTLKDFKGLPHRCQFVRKHREVMWYNDSKGTNVGATCAAIYGLGSEINGKIILIAGGVGKKADFSPLLPVLKQYVRHLVLIGEAASMLRTMVEGHVAYSMANDMLDAVDQAHNYAKSHDCVLLSPACASFDMFKNFEHRGEVFMQIVNELT